MFTEAYLEPRRTSKTELFCENSEKNCSRYLFLQKASSQMFDWVLNTPLID